MTKRNKLVLMLDQRFKDAREADSFLRDETGITNLDALSDKMCEELTVKLKDIWRVRSGSKC